MKKKECPKKASKKAKVTPKETLSEKLFLCIKLMLPLLVVISMAFFMAHEYRKNKANFSETEKQLLPTGRESFDVNVTSTALYPNPSGDQ